LQAFDDQDAITKESVGKFKTDYTQFLDVTGLKGKRIGVDKKPQGKDKTLHALLQKAVDILKQQGATIVEIEYSEKMDKLGDAEFEVLKYEFKDGLNKYLATANAGVKTLSDVIAFNNENEATAMPFFKQETLESSDKKGTLDAKEYKESLLKSRDGSRKILDDVIKTNQLHAICGLTMGPACSIDLVLGDHWGDFFLTAPAAMSGYPHICVPAGSVHDLPVGLSFFGAAYSEPELISIGYAYEQASKNRKLPAFIKTLTP
jgi:amidase